MVGFRAVPNRLVNTPTHTRVPARLQQKTHRAPVPVLTPFAPTRADPVASSAPNAGSPPAVPAPFRRERIGQGRLPVHLAGSLSPRSPFDRPTCWHSLLCSRRTSTRTGRAQNSTAGESPATLFSSQRIQKSPHSSAILSAMSSRWPEKSSIQPRRSRGVAAARDLR